MTNRCTDDHHEAVRGSVAHRFVNGRLATCLPTSTRSLLVDGELLLRRGDDRPNGIDVLGYVVNTDHVCTTIGSERSQGDR